jgi:hypothetical protein
VTLIVLTLLQYLSALGVLIGLVVFGGDFHSPSGYLYLIPLLVLPAVAPRLGPGPQRWLRRHARLGLTAGLVLGVVAYRPLHLGIWDQNSLPQAAALAAFATLSLAASWLAAVDITVGPPLQPWHLAAALTILAACYYVSQWYPDAPILLSALFLALGVAHPWRRDLSVVPTRLGRFDFLDVACFAVAAVLTDFVWDVDTDPAWGLQIAMAFLAGALAVLARSWPRRRPAPVPGAFDPVGCLSLFLAAIASVATAVNPAFLLHPLRQVLLGLALGTLVGAVIDRARYLGGAASLMRAWLAITLGVAVSSQFSLQLEALPSARVFYLLPAVALLGFALRRAGLARRGAAAVPAPAGKDSP